MAWVRVRELGRGQHSSEVALGVTTADGINETLILDRTSVENGAINVGYPVEGDEARLLVELPRETTSGQWRIWVNKADVLDKVPA